MAPSGSASWKKTVIFALVSCTTSFTDRGFWLLNKFQAEADCKPGNFIAPTFNFHPIWDEVHSASTACNEAILTGSECFELCLINQSVLIRTIMTPFEVVDPVMALQCPLGTAALLQGFGECLQLSKRNGQALRVLHLAKLFYLHRYHDLGEGTELSRWGLDINRIMLAIREAREEDPGVTRGSFETAPSSPPSVAIVSYCYYPNGNTNLPLWSRRNKEAFASLNGTRLFHFNSPLQPHAHAWMNKLLAIESAMESEAEWIMWVDCDAFFMTDASPGHVLQELLGKTSEYHLVISEDANMLNSAVFFLRNSPWGSDFLKTIKSLLNAPSPFSFRDNSYHEQSPMMYWLLLPGILDLSENYRSYRNEVLLADQKRFNAYPPEIALRSNFMHHASYTRGDWIVSFNGCGSLLGADVCESMWENYFRVGIL